MSVRLVQRVITKTGNYTISPDYDKSGQVFNNRGASGAVTLTLPPPTSKLIGWSYDLDVHADQSVTVAGHANGQIVAVSNAAANNVGFSASSKKVGRSLRVRCDGTQWVVVDFTASGFCVNGSEI